MKGVELSDLMVVVEQVTDLFERHNTCTMTGVTSDHLGGCLWTGSLNIETLRLSDFFQAPFSVSPTSFNFRNQHRYAESVFDDTHKHRIIQFESNDNGCR